MPALFTTVHFKSTERSTPALYFTCAGSHRKWRCFHSVRRPPQMDAFVEPIRQYPGQQQVDRAVQLNVPGKHFPGLTANEQKADYQGTAAEYQERHDFERHQKAWGAAHKGPGIRFICRSDAVDDPDTKGFWTTLGLWNRWRHDTYKDNRAGEVEFLDKKPEEPAAPAAAEAAPKTALPERTWLFCCHSKNIFLA